VRHGTTVLILAWLLGSAATAHGREQSILWTVEGRHNTVYLLGSIHVLRREDAELPAAAVRAYEDAERLVMEMDMDDPTQTGPGAMLAATERAALLPEGQTLHEVMGDDYAAVQAAFSRAGLDAALLDRYAPWFAAVTLLQLELAQRGFVPQYGIEQQLVARAAKDDKPIRGLETAQEQLGLLAGLPPPLQQRFLLMTLEESAHLDQELAELLRAWRTGDAPALARLLSAEYDAFPELYRPLSEDRNRAWLATLTDLLDDREDYLVVVGALHLVGRHGVVELLEQRGYEVEQQ
jgi:uncharacterized protein YbaP (TraB family)